MTRFIRPSGSRRLQQVYRGSPMFRVPTLVLFTSGKLPDWSQHSKHLSSSAHGVVGGAQCACEIAERGRNYAHRLSLRSPLDSLQVRGERFKEGGPCLGNPSSDDDNFRI